MHVQIPQNDLEAAATVVSNLAERSAGSSPILSNMLLIASEQGVQFRGADNEAMVTVNVNATVLEPGRSTIPAEKFRELVRILPLMSEVSIKEENGRITIECESNVYKLTSIPAEDFPEWPPVTGVTKFQLAQKTLKTLINGSTYALPIKDHRRVLLGVFFELSDHSLRLTATDGKKLARISTSVPEVEGQGAGKIVVPRKLLENVERSLGNEGPVEIEITGTDDSSARQIIFRFNNIVYRCNGIDGNYPDCDAVIPKDFPIIIPLNRDTFDTAIRRAGVTSDDKSKSIILRFENNECVFQSMAHDLGTFRGRLAIDYTAEPLELAFNFQYLHETLSKFSQPEVRMMIKSSKAPVVFKTPEEENRLALMMPIKLSDAQPPPPDDEEAEAEEEI